MKVRIILTVCILSISIASVCQEQYLKDTITDSRDGKLYQTIKIDNRVWLAENMKFKTEHSVEILANDFGIITDGYFYPYEEAGNVCPTDFEIPNESDWENYMEFLIDLKKIPNTSIEHFHTIKKRARGSGILVADNKLQIFEHPNPLNLQVSGIVQGGKLKSDGALTFWSRKDKLDDPKYHYHISPNGYSNHTHKHHVIAKKKKKRKFVVRCVKIE